MNNYRINIIKQIWNIKNIFKWLFVSIMKEIERIINERTILINEMKYEFSLLNKK